MSYLHTSADRCKLPRVFWQSIEQLGLDPSWIQQHAQLPDDLEWLSIASLTYIAYYVAVSLWLTFRARPSAGRSAAAVTADAEPDPAG